MLIILINMNGQRIAVHGDSISQIHEIDYTSCTVVINECGELTLITVLMSFETILELMTSAGQRFRNSSGPISQRRIRERDNSDVRQGE